MDRLEGGSSVILGLKTSQHLQDLNLPQTNFAVIGGNGFFGYKLVEALHALGARQIAVIDRQQTHFHGVPGITFHVGDVCDRDLMDRVTMEADVVFHIASFFGDPPFGSFGDGAAEHRVNVQGTRNAIRALKIHAKSRAPEAGPIKFIYFGTTSAVFNGEVPLKNAPDDTPYPKRHVDHYGRTKAMAEQETMKAHSPKDRLVTVVLRPNGIYGENEIIHIPRVIYVSRIFFNILPAYFDRNNLSDWTFVDNLIFASLLATQKLGNEGPVGGNVYNITDGEPIGYIDFFKPMAEAAGIWVIPLFYIPFFLLYPISFFFELICHILKPIIKIRPPLTRMEAIKIGTTHYFSIEKAKRDLGYFPIVTLKEGLERTSSFFRTYKPDHK